MPPIALRLALRSLRRTPAFSVTAIVTLVWMYIISIVILIGA